MGSLKLKCKAQILSTSALLLYRNGSASIQTALQKQLAVPQQLHALFWTDLLPGMFLSLTIQPTGIGTLSACTKHLSRDEECS